MACVQRCQEIDHLGAPHLTDDDPVRPHPQCLTHEIAHGDLPDTFDVRCSGDETHHMW